MIFRDQFGFMYVRCVSVRMYTYVECRAGLSTNSNARYTYIENNVAMNSCKRARTHNISTYSQFSCATHKSGKCALAPDIRINRALARAIYFMVAWNIFTRSHIRSQSDAYKNDFFFCILHHNRYNKKMPYTSIAFSNIFINTISCFIIA